LPGVSSGDVIEGVDRISLETLPLSMKAEWTELMFMQIKEGNTTGIVFCLAVVCVFLALAALYESWTLPLAVILVVPLCVLCCLIGVYYTNTSVNIFVQIGLVVLVGLACKNAILIVEFARQLTQARSASEGAPTQARSASEGSSLPLAGTSGLSPARLRFEATVEAARLRLRPILMTSFAFILGVVPLVFATGAGAEMRQSLGTAVFAGMLGVTLFGIFLTPVFFNVIQGLSEVRLFESALVRNVGSPAVGGLAGLTVGFLLARLTHQRLAWEVAIAATAAVLAALVVVALGRLAGRRHHA